MKLRGRRECTDCGGRWSYFETGGVACPDCGSVRSVAIDEAAVLHTASDAELDLSGARAAVDDRPLREVAAIAADACRAYLADCGFVDAGELQPLDDVTVAAAELQQAGDHLKRGLATEEDAEWYLLSLLQGATEGERPEPVPDAFRAAHGLGVAAAVERYRADLVRYLDEDPDPAARRVIGTLRDHLRRVEALEGDVPVEHADRLLAVTREVGAYLRGDEAALARATDRLDRL